MASYSIKFDETNHIQVKGGGPFARSSRGLGDAGVDVGLCQIDQFHARVVATAEVGFGGFAFGVLPVNFPNQTCRHVRLLLRVQASVAPRHQFAKRRNIYLKTTKTYLR